MEVKFILPALTKAKSPFWRPIKYWLFPPLGLATLADFWGLTTKRSGRRPCRDPAETLRTGPTPAGSNARFSRPRKTT
ncbi:MAG: hypothetical protein QOJ91_2747 [Sphingomonadales bacterium]|nr:hypothetical protein [Sphingomonadales bacterium]